jgi:hypothetical protein
MVAYADTSGPLTVKDLPLNIGLISPPEKTVS